MLAETIKSHLVYRSDINSNQLNFVELIGRLEQIKEAGYQYGINLKENTDIEDFMIFNRVCGFLDCSIGLMSSGNVHVSGDENPFK